MRLPYLQISQEVVEIAAPDLAILLDWTEPNAGWGLIHMIRWALARCPDNAPPSHNDVVLGPSAARLIARAAGWTGDPDAFVDATCSLTKPLLERVEGGIRFRGLDRYDTAWEAAQSRSARAKAAAEKRWAEDRAKKEAEEAARACAEHRPSIRRASPEHAPSIGQASPEHPKTNARAVLQHAQTQTQTQSSVPSEQAAPTPVQSSLLPGAGKRTDKPPSDPRHAPLTRAMGEEFLRQRGTAYAHRGGRDARDISALLTLGEPEEVLRRWRIGLAATFATTATPGDLVREWNRHATADPRARGPDTPFAPRTHSGDRPRL